LIQNRIPTGGREGKLFDLAVAVNKHFEDHGPLVASLARDQWIFGDRIQTIQRGRFMHANRRQLLASSPKSSLGRERGFLGGRRRRGSL
jgi:hypothetical protein